MRSIYLLAFGILSTSAAVFAQTDSITEISYTYDDAGNRTKRAITYYVQAKKSAEVVLSEEEIESEEGLNVYPNPASHTLYVTLNEKALDEDHREIIIFDNLGKQVIRRIASQQTNSLDVASLPVGTYILKLIYGTKHKEWIIIKN